MSLPGFGNPRPDGFGATQATSTSTGWSASSTPSASRCDLVGHDWGAGLTYRVATKYGDRLRSWAADCGSLAHPDYEWHDFAQIWQTPGEGEDVHADPGGAAARGAGRRAGRLFGISVEDATEMAGAQDRTMDDCILDLYRSAAPEPAHRLGTLAADVRAGADRAPHRGHVQHRAPRPRGGGAARRQGRGARRRRATSGPTRPPSKGQPCSRSSGLRSTEAALSRPVAACAAIASTGTGGGTPRRQSRT